MSVITKILAVVLLFPLFWLSVRIRGVWRGTKPVPPISFLVRGYEITERNFPALGTGICCLICVWELNTVTNWLIGFSDSPLLLVLVALSLLLAVVGLLFIVIGISIAWFGRPKFVIPPAQREEHAAGRHPASERGAQR
jgi:hypothetical protein